MAYVVFLTWAFLLTLISWVQPRYGPITGPILLVSAIAFAGFRGASDDYRQYVNMFHALAGSSLPLIPRLYIGKDPLFGALMLGGDWLGFRTQGLFLIAAAAALCLKAVAFQDVFGSYVTPLFVTICSTYFLHEYTQIRVAIALGFAFLALVALMRERKVIWAICSMLAIGFHISALAILLAEIPFVFGIYKPLWLAVYALVGLMIVAVTADFLTLLSDIASRAASYKWEGHVSSHGLLVAVFRIIVTTGLTYVVLQGERETVRRRLWTICYFLQLLGFGVFLIFLHRAAGLGFRVMELFDGFDVFIVSAALLVRGKLTWAVALQYCLVLLFLVSNVWVPYQMTTRPIW